MNRTLRVEKLSIRTADLVLCRGLSFSVGPGEVLTLMGPSGCGKSIILSHITGALSPAFSASGSVRLGEEEITGLPMERRRIGILFQDDLLFPHMTVLENLLFAAPKGPPAPRIAAAEEALAAVGLSGLGGRHPDTLSGGQKARISLMRALLGRPRAILLDEPFAKLDKPLRKRFRELVFDKIRAMAIPALLVTHDMDDAPPGGAIKALTEENTPC